MKKTRKLLALLLVTVMALSACGGGSTPTTTAKPAETTTQAPAPADTTTQAPAPAETTTQAPAPAETTTKAPEETTEEVTTEAPTDAPVDPAKEGTYTYNDYTSTLGANWNPHTYQTTDEGYTMTYTTTALYEFLFNETFDGYEIVPAMAAEKPVDVTEQVKADHPEFNIPETATKGFAYTIALNPDAKWDDGTPIKAVDYVESIKRLIDPKALNYRSADIVTGNFVLANADAYFNQGSVSGTEPMVSEAYGDDEYIDPAEFVTGDDGFLYYDDKPIVLLLDNGGNWGDGLNSYAEKLADVQEAYDRLKEAADSKGTVQLTPDLLKDLQDCIAALHGHANVEAYAEAEGDYAYQEFEEMAFWGKAYEADYSFDNVGIIASGEYELTVALSKSLSGFYLLYDINGLSTWLVKTDLYDKLQTAVNDTYSSTYCTSVETSASFGPYKITEYQQDKYIQLEKNENWFGWDSDIYKYVDPEDGETYQMYMTDVINCQVIAETATQRDMFLSGKLATFGLGSEDFDAYRSSDYAYVTPQATIFFFIFNGYLSVIQEREAAADFDQTKNDLETLTLQSFRRAVAVSYDKELLCATISPARSGGYGIIGKGYIYDPDTGAEYRNTDVARQVLCDFYSVDTSKFANLEEAVASITGYDPVAAKELYQEAFKEALEKGYITSADGKTCDQEIKITYSASTISDFITKTMNYLNEKMAEATEGTPFEGKITFEAIAFNNDWSNKIRSGQADTVLGGWNGSLLNPYSVISLYTNPAQAYDAKWFDTKAEKFTIEVEGEKITMSLFDWGECLNGAEVDGRNFGADAATQEVRLQIMAALEGRILQTYDYIPMMQNAGMSLLSKKMFWVTEEYNAVMGRGGIAYLKYNYNDAEWDAYVKEQGGVLQY